MGACLAEDDPTPDAAEALTCDDPIETTTYRSDAIDVPETTDEGRVLGRDLDGDGSIDNQGASLYGALFNVVYAQDNARAGFYAQIDARLGGDLAWLVEIARCPTTDEVRASLLRGEIVDGGVRVVAVPGERGAAGSIDATGGLLASEGIGALPVGALSDLLGGADEGWHRGTHLTFAVELDGDQLDGVVATGLVPGYDAMIARGFLPYLDQLMASGQSEWAARLDADGDANGTISEAELTGSDLFQTLMRPDLDLIIDGEADSMSLGISVHAVAVAVVP